MKKTLTSVLTLATAGVLWLHVPCVSAQDAPPPAPPAGAPAGGPGAGGPGGRGGDWQQRRNEMAKTMLKASDEEWSVIQPLLEKVVTIQRESGGGMMGGMMGGGRPQRRDNAANGGEGKGGGGNRPDRGPGRGGSPESQALIETLKNDSASSEEIKTKLAAVREQRKKSAVELTQAREDLKKVLNMRQEASLVAVGILE